MALKQTQEIIGFFFVDFLLVLFNHLQSPGPCFVWSSLLSELPLKVHPALLFSFALVSGCGEMALALFLPDSREWKGPKRNMKYELLTHNSH